MENWAVDLANIGAVYPWRGSEKIMALAGIVAWLVWHIVQMRAEAREFDADIAAHGTDEQIRQALDRDV